jgi:hypothetical protein
MARPAEQFPLAIVHHSEFIAPHSGFIVHHHIYHVDEPSCLATISVSVTSWLTEAAI